MNTMYMVMRAVLPAEWERFDKARAEAKSAVIKALDMELKQEKAIDALTLERSAWIELYSSWYAFVHSTVFSGRVPDADRFLADPSRVV